MRNRFTNLTVLSGHTLSGHTLSRHSLSGHSLSGHTLSRQSLVVGTRPISPMRTVALKLVVVWDFSKPFESEQYS